MPKPWENMTQDEKIEELRRDLVKLERKVAELAPKPLKHPLLAKPAAAKRKQRP